MPDETKNYLKKFNFDPDPENGDFKVEIPEGMMSIEKLQSINYNDADPNVFHFIKHRDDSNPNFPFYKNLYNLILKLTYVHNFIYNNNGPYSPEYVKYDGIIRDAIAFLTELNDHKFSYHV